MFEAEEHKVNEYRKAKKWSTILWFVVKFTIAYLLIAFLDYGLFIVIGYVLYAIENISAHQFVNSQEVDLQLNILHQRINEIEGQ